MPGSIRLFVPAALREAAEIEASVAQAHYLATVMRRAVGETVLLFNGIDGEWEARILSLKRDRVRLGAERQTRRQTPEPDLWLLFAPLKRDATDLMVQKATELGAAALLPVITGRTNASRINEARLRMIAVEAAEQCERLTLPRIEALRPLVEVLADWPAGRLLAVAAERLQAPWVQPVSGPAALLIGPEGGFAPAELDALQRHPFVVPASLGPRILRAETAAIVGLALLQAPSGG